MEFQNPADREAWITFCAAALTGIVRSEKQIDPTHIHAPAIAQEAGLIADEMLAVL